MTTGALIFAFNNEETDYLAMAAWSADNIRRHLNIPVAVVTDADPGDSRVSGFDRVITVVPQTGGTRYFEDYEKTVSWHNAGRTDAYHLSPYDKTLVLDADYVVASSDLRNIIDADSDFQCFKTAFDLSRGEPLTELNQFGQHNLPMWWATVMMFRRSNTAQYIFDCMNMIKDNWQHYRDLYGIQKSTYRNDFALSIAIGIVSGHTGKVDEIPWDLNSIMPDTQLSKVFGQHDAYDMQYTTSDKKLKHLAFFGMDFHAMGKKHLGDIIEADRRTRLLDSSTEHQER
jgi:hypothetical protein